MFHERIDLDHWITLCPLDTVVGKLREQRRADGFETSDHPLSFLEVATGDVFSARDLAIHEQAKQRMRDSATIADNPGVPCDVCVWSAGEPEEPRCTKIGGVPFWPSAWPWPTDSSGQELSFVAQFNFLDSADILTPTPSNILVIFAAMDDHYLDEPVRMFWVPPDTGNIVRLGDVPRSANLQPIYAHLCRVHDNFELDAQLPALADPAGVYVSDGDYLGVNSGTKIGGIATMIQGPPFSETLSDMKGRPIINDGRDQKSDAFSESDLRVLFMLNSGGPSVLDPWPFLNRAEPLERITPNSMMSFEDTFLQIGDAGTLYARLDEIGNVEWTGQCY